MGGELRTFSGFGQQAWKIAFSPDGRRLAAGTSDTTIRLKDVVSGRDLGMIADHGRSDSLSAIAFSADGHTLASTNDDYTVRLWDIKSLRPYCERFPCNESLRELEGHTDHIYSIAFSPDGSTLASGSSDNTVKIWNVRSGKEFKTLRGHEGTVGAVGFSPDGRILATGANDFKIKLWDTLSGNELRTLIGHTGRITDLCFSADGHTIASASADRTIKLWDVVAGHEIRQFIGHRDTVYAVAFSPDGRMLASGSEDSTVRLWDPSTGTLLCSLFALDDGSWIVADPNGRFDTNSADEIRGVSWVFPDEPLHALAPEIFMRDYYQPRLVQKLFRGEKLAPLRAVAELNRSQPRVEVLKAEPENEDGFASVTVRVSETQSATQKDGSGQLIRSGAFDLRLFRDGRLVAQWPDIDESERQSMPAAESAIASWRRLHRIDLNAGEFTHTFSHIRLPHAASTTRFTAYAFNSDRVKSSTSAALDLKRQGATEHKLPSGRAYIITAGVNANESRWNLELAVSSAHQMGALLAAKLKKDYGQIVNISLDSDLAEDSQQPKLTKARKANFKAVLDLLAGRPVPPSLRTEFDPEHQIEAAEPNDAVLLYIASHGYADLDGNFFVIPYDTGSNWGVTAEVLNHCPIAASLSTDCAEARNFLEHSISSAELASWWQGVDAGEMLMILDSCHAGAVSGKKFRPAPLGDPGFGQLSYDKGMRVLCAAQPAQSARGQWIGGGEGRTLLAEAFLRISRTNSDQSLSEWLKSAQRQTPLVLKEIYPGIASDNLQTPELFDFVRGTAAAR